ncbi:MAG TPA: carboxypeptidase regulatory-like domain-containing protein [Bryobacteraceae bacterium]|nr:carboxypeptidase regulatory-like domain-containing protein [Bryobacteraceae bacterium]
MKTVTLALLAVLICAALVQAQTETGQITGVIFDQSGGVIPNATVTAVDPTTKATRTNMTSSGVYVFPNLSTGRYEVTATANGFQTTKQVVTVTVGSKIGLDFHLQVGTQSQVIEVQEQAARVNTETQVMGANISSREILDLPTLTRNPYDLVKTIGNTTNADTDSTGNPPARGVGVSINGLRSSDVGILLDGVPNSNNFDTTVALQTPLDSVGEISVLTNTFTAEFGRALAGVVNVDTKRGENAFHGTAYEFNRVSALTSNTYENNATGIPISPFTRNQFGFSLGGPFKKDKLFFFGNPEWLRVRSVFTQEATIATPQLIAASAPATQQFFSAYGKLAPNVTPLQTFTYGQACTTAAICTMLPGNTPAYQLVAFSVPQDAGGGAPGDTFSFAGRVDYVISDNSQLYFRYARYYQTVTNGDVNASPYAGYNTGEEDRKDAYALSYTRILSPNVVSQTKLSFNRIDKEQPLVSAARPTLFTTLSSTGTLGGQPVIYPGYNAFNPAGALPSGGPQNYIQLNEDVTRVWGKHNFRFGGLYTYLQDNESFGAFENAVEALGTDASTAVNALLSGTIHEFQAAIYPQGKFPCINGVVTPACTLTLPIGSPNFSRSNLYHEAALYAQDGWKVKPRLTLNLGLRWEYFGPQANRDPALDSNFFFGPGSNVETQTATGQLFTSNNPANPVGGLWAKRWLNFEPRVGFAYDLFGDGKTAIRGGYGLGFVPNFGNVTFNVIQNPPNYAVTGLISGVDVPTIPIETNVAGPFAGSSGSKAFTPSTLRAVNPNIATAYAHLWSVSVEHQFGTDLIAALEYSGSKGSELYTIDRLNIPGSQLVYTGTGSTTARLNPQYSYINFRTNGGFSHYNGLNTRLDLRNFRKQGLTLRANYTWSHAIDNISNTFSDAVTGSGNLGVLDPLHPGLDRGDAEFDVRHRFTLAGIWDVPFKGNNKVMREIAGGWTIVPNYSVRSGTPFSVFDCTNAGYVFCPRVMYDQAFQASYGAAPTSTPNVFNYLNLGSPDHSYANPLVGVSDFGPFPASMTGRDAFRSPGNWNIDLAVYKSFAVTERFKLQFRAEAYNAFNHSNLYIVNANTDASATSFIQAQKGTYFNNNLFGGPTTENRNLQLALKLIF